MSGRWRACSLRELAARVGGRRRALTTAQLAHAETMAAAGTPIREIADILGAGRSTVYRALKQPS
jgi:DNA invertase Pin-like site-specific DNA recombinase